VGWHPFRFRGGAMSYWPELLIESYHLMKELSKECLNGGEQCGVPNRLDIQAEKIKKRMKSLGYYDCWEENDNVKVEVP
jgi:hypothetical protein